ncbi:hypothetical protein AK830_g8407 [Neonectria ditissima]|uniref:Fe2OG dioxygenase domain-containing protein n=1 Tax=Neonectria ditissima TaxID=78410 RepID=A0A0P7BCL7_9HYPO|nr:hypothetical protein AK830_g8407 [Neonectria ditissima]
MAAITTSLHGSAIPPSTSTFDTPEPAPVSSSSIRLLSPSLTIVSFEPETKTPSGAIRRLFDHLKAHPEIEFSLNATYPKRGVFKTAATHNAAADQKFTIDLSPTRNAKIPESLRGALTGTGFDEVLDFFDHVRDTYVTTILSTLSAIAGADLHQVHKSGNINYRLCDYSTDTADPESDNGCGAHADYGTISIIFQDGTPGLEMEEAEKPGIWVPVPGDATVVLAGWCAVILSGGRIRATRHRVRRTPGVRRLSAVLFVAPDLDIKPKPLDTVEITRPLSQGIMTGEIDVGWFKEVMGKKWSKREGNERMNGDEVGSQDSEIETLIWG